MRLEYHISATWKAARLSEMFTLHFMHRINQEFVDLFILEYNYTYTIDYFCCSNKNELLVEFFVKKG